MAKIDELGDVAVGFSKVLADFKNQPGFQFELALLEDLANPEKQLRAFFQRSAAPGLKSLERGLHGRLNFGWASLMVKANYFRWLRWIGRGRGVAGLDAASTNNQVVFAA